MEGLPISRSPAGRIAGCRASRTNLLYEYSGRRYVLIVPCFLLQTDRKYYPYGSNLFGSEPTTVDNLNTTLSFGLFVSSALAFGWAGNLIGDKRRLWFLISNITTATLILAATVLHRLEEDGVQIYAGPGIVGLLATACGGQPQLALSTRMPELNTVMVTGAIARLARDRRLLSTKNHARTRRFLYWFSILAGALVGAVISKFAGPTSAIFIAAVRSQDSDRNTLLAKPWSTRMKKPGSGATR